MCKSIIKQVVGQSGAYSSQIGEQTSKRGGVGGAKYRG